MLPVLVQAVRRRRGGLVWWSLGLVGLVGLLAVAYPTVRDNAELDKTFAGLPPAVQGLFGLGGQTTLTSPVGYLNSQFFANLLPVMLLVYAVGMAAWAIAGDEAAGTLELLLANPVSRARVAAGRAGALLALLAALTAVCAAALLATAPAAGLDQDLPASHLLAATLACALLALVHAAVAFAVGAATGRRPLAAATASAVAVAGFVVQGLAQQVKVLRPVRAASPWHWLLDGDPLRHGLVWRSWVLPLAVTAVLLVLGTLRFQGRDLR